MNASSDGDLGAALTAARGEDRLAGAGPHTQAEAVLLVTTTVVRLESALAHGWLLLRCLMMGVASGARLVPRSGGPPSVT